jgi:hypothetical protein
MKNFLLVFVVALTGCVAGQNINLQYDPTPKQGAALHQTVAVTVEDKRSYVTDGDKQPWYIGHYRAGFGNTWDVTTRDKVPFATQVKADLQKELTSLGFTEGSDSHAKRVTVVIKDWNFDAMVNGKLWYDLEITVRSSDGAVLATSDVKDERVIKGSIWTGAKGAMTEEVPVMYGEVLQSLIRNNAPIMEALRKT